MGSRVITSEKAARGYAAQHGVTVSKIFKVLDCKEIKVGSALVTYDPKTGGCACWAVNGQRVGYVGEAIQWAVDNAQGETK